MAAPSDGSKRLRPLLPRPPESTPVVQPSSSTEKRKVRIRIACDSCRRNKTKCSSDHPKCTECVKRDLECWYETDTGETRLKGLKRKIEELKSQKSPYETLFDLMKSVPEKDARDILKRIRQGADVETLLNHMADGDLLLQLHVVPETRYRYKLPYISTMPANLLVGDNPYLSSFFYEAEGIYPLDGVPEISRQSGPSSQPGKSGKMPQLPKAGPGPYEDVYQKPFHAATVIDPRISKAKLSRWTSVCEDDVLMRNLLSVWLQCEYQFTAIFQKDLFLDDLAAQRLDFCSSLLVNMILGYACVCYSRFTNRAQYWNPKTLTYRFRAEAKRLWELEANKPRITTIHAAILFNVFYNLSGLDEVGQAYRKQALALAHQMRLFTSAAFEGQNARICHGTGYTAWALFNWETLVGFSFMVAPLVSEPPDWILPDPVRYAGWYGEIWVRYPLHNHLVPSYFANNFYSRSLFRIIMNRASQAAYSDFPETSLENAYELLSQLKGWFDGLSGPLLPKSIVLPAHLQLHMYYHHLILTIFKPLLDEPSNQIPSPKQIVDDASKYLQTLIRIYYLRHGFEAMDLFIVIPLVLAAYDCLDLINEHTPASELESLRSTLILVAGGLYAQRQNHYLAEALFRVVRGRMRPVEISLFKGIMNVDEVDESPDMEQQIRSHWPVTVVKKKEELDSYVLANLVENYAHLNVQGESSGSSGSKKT